MTKDVGVIAVRAGWAAALVLAACGAPPTRPLGVRENLDEARRHEADAARLDDHAAAVEAAAIRDGRAGPRCVENSAPCWSREADVARANRDEAARLRDDAAVHRAQARALAAAELASCADLPASELDHTPFAHRDDIVAVTAALDGDVLRGAVVRFRTVPGLTAAWLEGAIACHHARATALGFDPAYLGYDPTVLAGVTVEVRDAAAGPVVELRAADADTALLAYLRAEALVAP